MSKKLAFLVIMLVVVWWISPAIGQPPASTPGAKKFLFEYFYDIGSGTAITDLTGNAKYPDHPDASVWMDSLLHPAGATAGVDWKNNYGARGRGYLYPPATGDYTFWVAGDDLCELWLSTDDTAAKAVRIANITGWTPAQDWNNTGGGSTDGAAMKSKAISLKAGQKYYIEVLLKEASGGDSVGAAWSGPGITGPVLIAGKYLSAFIRDPEPMFLAQSPNPADGATGVLFTTVTMLLWTKGATASMHDVYFGTDPNPPKVGRTTQPMYISMAPVVPGTTYYWRVDEIESNGTVRKGNIWSFTTAPLAAFGPVPRNGDKWIDPNSDLAWQAGATANSHDVYFGTNKDTVAARDASVFVGKELPGPSFELAPLTAATTYYWLVDEYDSVGTKYEGTVWSFTTNDPAKTGGIKAEYFNNTAFSGAPFLTQIEPGIDHSWADGTGPAAGVTDNFSVRWTADLEIAVADTYTFIANTDDGVRVWLNDQQIINDWIGKAASDDPSKPIALEPGIYSLVMEYYESTSGASAQLYWEGKTFARELIPAGPLQPPVRAKPINPKDNDVNVPQDVTLMWSAGEKAVTHQVYFGDDEAAVAAATTADAGLYKGSQAKEENTFQPGALEWGKTYYWRVDEVNDASAESPWAGGVASFTTANFLVIDNFESYTDNDTGRIFQTWIDGWGYTTPEPGNPGNGTGATVGYIDPPFAEHSTIHSGGTSMPLGYDNTVSPFYSETERTFDTVQNWTVNGVNTLSLQVRGYPQVTTTSVTETGGKMNLTGAGTDMWGASDQFTFAYKTLSGDGSIVAKVVSVGTGSNTWAKGGVIIRDDLTGASASAQMCITGSAGNGACFQHRATAGLDMSANDATSSTTIPAVVAPPYWVKLERVGDTFNAYTSPDGTAWTILNSADVVMTGTIYIGLCVTSHAAGEDRTFQFESIKTTGNVTGAWQGAVIDSPTYNAPADLYVAIQDSAGKIAVAKDATVVNAATWTEVKMPLSSFTGVSMNKVKKLYIGVGNRTTPVAGGTGKLFIDDIYVIKQ